MGQFLKIFFLNFFFTVIQFILYRVSVFILRDSEVCGHAVSEREEGVET